VKLAKQLSEKNVPLNIFEHCENTANYSVLEAEYRHFSVIVDLQCAGSFEKFTAYVAAI
jgi:hypothetical protein